MSYPPTSAPLPPQTNEQYPQLSSLLRTEDGFKKLVRFSGGASIAMGIVLVVALILLVRNIFATVGALARIGDGWDRYFFDVFFSTASETSDNDPILWIQVWGPIIAIPVVLLLFIIRLATRDSSMMKLFHRYNSGGFVAALVPTGVDLAWSNYKAKLFAIAAPSVPADWAVSAAQQIAATTGQDKDRITAWRTAVMADATVVAATTVDPSVPAGILVTGLPAYDGRPRAIIPNDKDPSKYTLYVLKASTPIG